MMVSIKREEVSAWSVLKAKHATPSMAPASLAINPAKTPGRNRARAHITSQAKQAQQSTQARGLKLSRDKPGCTTTRAAAPLPAP